MAFRRSLHLFAESILPPLARWNRYAATPTDLPKWRWCWKGKPFEPRSALRIMIRTMPDKIHGKNPNSNMSLGFGGLQVFFWTTAGPNGSKLSLSTSHVFWALSAAQTFGNPISVDTENGCGAVLQAWWLFAIRDQDPMYWAWTMNIYIYLSYNIYYILSTYLIQYLLYIKWLMGLCKKRVPRFTQCLVIIFPVEIAVLGYPSSSDKPK